MSSKSNIFVTIVLLFIFILSAPALSKSRPAEKERLKFKNNKIAAMNEFLFFPKTNTQKKMAVQTFDINGNKLSVVEFDNNEKQIKKVEYTYDADNNEISFVEYGASDKVRQKCVNKYDDKKENLIEELFYNAAGSLGYRRIAKIDRNNNISEQSLYDKNNKFINRSAHKYDRNANKIETNIYNAANVFNGRFVYNYDKNDNLTESLSYDKNNKFSGKKIYNYDKNDLLIETIGYNASGKANSWRKYEYEHHKVVATITKPVTESVNKIEPAKKPVEIVALPPHKDENADRPQPEPRLDYVVEKSPDVTSVSVTDKKNDYLKNDYYNPPPDVIMDPIVLIGNCGFYPENTVIKLIEHNNIDVNSVNELGQSLLMIAACSGRIQLVEELIKKGAKPDQKDFNGNSVLDFAMSGKNSRIIKAIKNATEK